MLTKPPQPKGKLDTVTVNGPEDVPEWDAIDWRVHEGNVGRLRRRIFKATREQNWAQARSLQKMTTRNALAACLSRVRRRVACTVLRGARRSNAPRLPDLHAITVCAIPRCGDACKATFRACGVRNVALRPSQLRIELHLRA